MELDWKWNRIGLGLEFHCNEKKIGYEWVWSWIEIGLKLD